MTERVKIPLIGQIAEVKRELMFCQEHEADIRAYIAEKRDGSARQ